MLQKYIARLRPDGWRTLSCNFLVMMSMTTTVDDIKIKAVTIIVAGPWICDHVLLESMNPWFFAFKNTYWYINSIWWQV